ncbi:MAG: hypothetical protein KDF64_01070 [Geminicoccaceae bacterium]|nr:hypothetical protein [Geminicoccaceae bacterium]
MIRLAVLLAVWSILGIIGAWLADSGMVSIAWKDYDIRVHGGLLVGGVVVILLLTVILFEIWHWLLGLPGRRRERKRHERQTTGYHALSQGMIAAAAGDAVAAAMHSRQASRLLEDEPATLLLSAQTAQLEGKEDVAQLRFKDMLEEPETRFLGLRGLLADAVQRGAYEEALTLAREAHSLRPSTPWVLTTLFDLLTRAELWKEAMEVVNQIGRLKLFDHDELQRRRALLHHMMAEEALDDDRLEDALAYAREANRRFAHFSPSTVLAASVAAALGRAGQARKILERGWELAPHPEIADAYARLEDGEDPSSRLRRFARLESLQPGHALTHVVMAELAMAAGEWKTARKHLDAALERDPTAGVYRLYADFERESGSGHEKARSWLAKTLDAQPDDCWVCDDSGEVLPEWHLYGPTGRFDSVRWQRPPKIVRLAAGQRPAYALPHEDLGETPHPPRGPLERLRQISRLDRPDPAN